MKMSNGYFSIIQYCPSLSRAEVANIGILLFCPKLNYIDAKFSRANDRVSTIFGRGTFDKKRLNLTKQSIRDRLILDRKRFRELLDLDNYIDEMANEIKITRPRSIKVIKPEIELVDLFNKLVVDRDMKVKVSTEAFNRLDALMRKPTLKNRVKFKQTVVIPIIERNLHIDYSFNNGALNHVKTQFFHMDSSGITQALALATEGHFLQNKKTNGIKQKLVIVADADRSTARRNYAERITNVFDELRIKTVWDSEIELFVAEVERDAH